MSALFLKLARPGLFRSSSPQMFRLRMISSTVVFAPHGEVAKKFPVVRLATHKLIVSLDTVVGVELLATTLACKHMATVLANLVMDRNLQRPESFVADITGGEPSLSLVLCPPTLIPSSSSMNSLTNVPSTPAGPGASR